MPPRGLLLLIVPLVGAACHTTPPVHREPESQGASLLGRPLLPTPIDPQQRTKLEDDLAAALAAYRARPDSEDAAIWVGRRLGYLQRYTEAIEVFSDALRRHPESYRLLRHRGHRYITLRRLDEALADLNRAAQLSQGAPDRPEPDGQPNAAGTPRGTDKSSILYHLGLAQYLRGDFAGAARTYRRSLSLPTTNDDNRVSASYWIFLSLRRLERDAEAAAVLAPIHDKMEVLENRSYFRLLLAYKAGAIPPDLLAQVGAETIDNATIGYGVGAWMLVSARKDEARTIFQNLVDRAPWGAFGVIAAEAELAREQKQP